MTIKKTKSKEELYQWMCEKGLIKEPRHVKPTEEEYEKGAENYIFSETDYIFRDYRLKDGILSKNNIDEAKHLMWKYGGVPMIDAGLWDRYSDRIKKIVITTDKHRTFEISGEEFETGKEAEDYGFGRQYYINKNKWTITSLEEDIKKAEEEYNNGDCPTLKKL